jgi:hypothetical protein
MYAGNRTGMTGRTARPRTKKIRKKFKAYREGAYGR